MAIYISGVKNLPEQVQKNKDDIEDLQTADTNLDAKIDQAIADRKEIIDASGNAIIIKNPTENVIVSLNETLTNRIFGVSIDGTPKLSIDEASIVANEDTAVNGDLVVSGDITGHGDLDIDGNITATGNISVDNASVSGNITAGGNVEIDGNILANSMQDRDSYGAITLPNQANDDVVIINASSGTAHILKFDKDGNLTIDGNEVGGKPLYMHSYTFALSGQAISYWGVLYSDIATPFTAPTLADYLYNKGITSGGNSSPYKALRLTNSASDTIYTFSIFSADGTELKMAREGGASQLIATVNDLVQRIL